MQPQTSTSQSSHLTARVFDFIDIHPSQIKHLSFNQNSSTLSIARKDYSQIYYLSLIQQSKPLKPVVSQQLLVLQPCQHIYQIDGYIILVMPYQLKVSKNGKWYNYPFTTQLLPIAARHLPQANQLITFHASQARLWTFSQDDGIDIKHLNKNQTPYHVNSQGLIEGYGKKIKPNGYKQTKFTVLSETTGFLFAGTNKGQLSVYETKYMTHVKTFHRHEGAILAIKCYQNTCYFTGSDSKVSSIIQVQNQNDKSGTWVLGNQVRGQSHDILALQFITLGNNQNLLVSGGITTDLCLYSLSSLSLTQTYFHLISYSSQKLTHFVYPYLLVNKNSSFEIWKINSQKQYTELLVRYQVAFYKTIHQILMKKSQTKNHENKLLIFVLFADQGMMWQFDEQNGLNKMLTVKNQYNLAEWYQKQQLITLRDANKLQIFNFKTGNIKQIIDINVQFPTQLKLSEKGNRILIASKYTHYIQVYQLVKQKSTKLVLNLHLQHPFDIVDFCYYNPLNLMIKKHDSKQIQQIDRKGIQIQKIVKLPFNKVRDFGWLGFTTKSKNKIFWYAVGQTKISIISKMKQQSLKKKVRVKQMPRIGNVVINNNYKKQQQQIEEIQNQWNIGIIPLNFAKMIEQQIMPIMTKKIL